MIYKIIGLPILTFVLFGGYGYYSYKTKFGNWEGVNLSKKDITISWAKFEWNNEFLGSKYVERVSMNIPARIEGIANNVTFQFDIGSNYTKIYENPVKSIYEIDETYLNKIKNPVQFWNKIGTIKDISIVFGNYKFTSKNTYVLKNHGSVVSKENILKGDTIHIGTIGADMFQNKILIIDYPNQRFAILDEVPKEYKDNLIDIEIKKNGMPILPMKINGNIYKIGFDNGSSIFPIICLEKNTNKFSSNPDIDTLKISSWGVQHDVTGKMITDTFELAGQRFSNVKVYTNHAGLGIGSSTDGNTGNALFWDKTIIIDYKHKKFGVK